MRLLRLCLLILALRLFLSDPIMIYVSFVVFSIGRIVDATGANGQICNYLLPEKSSRKRISGRFLCMFCHHASMPGMQNFHYARGRGNISPYTLQISNHIRMSI